MLGGGGGHGPPCCKIGPNGLPIRVRDTSQDPTSGSQQAKDKAAPSKSLN